MSAMSDWFDEPGAYVLVDGQFGSTGKGLLAGWMAWQFRNAITHVTTNAGPNSGHTAYFGRIHDDPLKIVTQQIPIASVFLEKMGIPVTTLLNAGAVIDEMILLEEQRLYPSISRLTQGLFIHPSAALIRNRHRIEDERTQRMIAGTGKGIGPAISDKVSRQNNDVVARHIYMPMMPANRLDRTWDDFWDWQHDRVFVETAQGFSLGLNQARFYPTVTSRECTVMQAIADARIPAQMVKKVIMTLRTFPIRVGNTAGSSGDPYPDQHEMTWEDVGQPPEMTTVTKRVRRVFSWSRIQFREAVAANRPDVLFLNFCNYLSQPQLDKLILDVINDYDDIMGREPGLLLGFGPYSSDIHER